MGYDIEKQKNSLEEYKELCKKLKEMKSQNGYLLDIKKDEEYEEQIEKCDRDLSLLRGEYDKLQREYNYSTLATHEQIIPKLLELKQQIELLNSKNAVLWDAFDLQSKINELKCFITGTFTQVAAERRNNDIHSLFAEAKNLDELRVFIDAACISLYKVPLLVALITKDPKEIEADIQVSDLSWDLRDKVVEYIEQKKMEISKNLILSDKALIDLVEHATGQNIVKQQMHNERVHTIYNRQFFGKRLLDRGQDFSLLSNQARSHGSTVGSRSTAGKIIKRFSDIGSLNQFDRSDCDMLVKNYPGIESEDFMYTSFSSMPNERKRLLISAIISNLELCYEMFQSYYLSNDIEIPVLINLTNGKSFNVTFKERNLPHILGISGTHGYDQTTQSFYLELPQATIDLLELTNSGGGALDVLKKIVGKDENGNPYKNQDGVPYKDLIIEKCGLNYDSTSHRYYEMFPWERIILKTNAFIRGDFFKTTSLISPINPNSFLIAANDEIKRISIAPTRFGQSALNQTPIDPRVSFDKAIRILRNPDPSLDFTFKGMMYDSRNSLWIPRTNVSAIGERITPYNAGTLKTLEKYRYLISGISNPSEGGFIASVESLKEDGPNKEYSAEEMLGSLIEIANSFGTTEEIQNNLKLYLEQVQDVYNKQNKDEHNNRGSK